MCRASVPALCRQAHCHSFDACPLPSCAFLRNKVCDKHHSYSETAIPHALSVIAIQIDVLIVFLMKLFSLLLVVVIFTSPLVSTIYLYLRMLCFVLAHSVCTFHLGACWRDVQAWTER